MEEPLTPRQVRAARAILAWKQSDLARAANVAVSTVADFERGERTPVANNVQAILDAFAAEGVRLEAGGAVKRPQAAPIAKAEPGRPFRWITATDLVDWAGRHDGPAGFPELISRLISVSVGPVAMRFPADDSIRHAGWDGYCDSPEANDFVPAGVSVWEMGAQRQAIGRKADEDYNKRTKDPLGVLPAETTYVFATPHRWPQKDAWAAEKCAQGVWKNVRVIDGDILVHWLERHPGVAEWLASRIGKRPVGLFGLASRWDQWSLATKPPLPPSLILADRDDEAAAILKWLYGDAEHLSVQAESSDEAIAFLHAALDALPESYRLYWLSRIVVAETDRAALELEPLGAKLAIVLDGGDPGLAQRLVAAGHHVYSAHGSEAGAPDDVLRLPRPWTHSIDKALHDAGLDETKARQFSGAAGRSLAVLRRLMPAGAAPRPAWASSPAPAGLVAAMLAGAWHSENAIDRQVLERLSDMNYDALEAALAPLADALDTPLRRSGKIWKLTSLRDAWFLFAGQLTVSQVSGLLDAFHEVLTDPDPAFDDPDRPWRFELKEANRASSVLRRGLTEAVIALGLYGERATGVPDATRRAEQAVRRLFQGADQRRWWSLSHDFRLLAEASPEAFLAALDEALSDPKRDIMVLFRTDKGFVHAQEYLADLLWALELLAWSPDHVGAVALLLARLADVDPGGEISNRPAESLRRILLPWRPQTVANSDERLALIRRILKLYPKVGWDLLLAIAPDFRGGITHNTSTPRWRVFAADAPERITPQGLSAAYGAIGDLLIENAGAGSGRWKQLLDLWPSFPPTWREKAAAALACAAPELEKDERTETREALRSFLHKHERYAHADWAIGADELEPLRTIFSRLQPTSALHRHEWLFSNANRSFDPKLGWREAQELLRKAQCKAAEEILAEAGPPDIIDRAEAVQRPWEFGFAIGSCAAADSLQDAVLAQAATDPSEAAGHLAQGLLRGRVTRTGEPWLETLFDQWVAEQRPALALSRVALVLNPDADNWARIAAAGAEIDQAYWRGIYTYAIPKEADPTFFLAKLLEVGRGRAALEYIGGHDEVAVPTGQILAVLRHESTIHPEVKDSSDETMFSYYVGEIFKRFDQADDVDEASLVELEWTYFQALRDSERSPRLLHKALAEDPAFFVRLVEILYRADDEEPRVLEGDEAERAKVMFSQAFNVLASWTNVPGTRADGTIDGGALEAWVKQARLLLAKSRRAEIGDVKIGEVLSAAPRVEGESWPPEPIRDIIDICRSRDLESGFETGHYNRRGVTMRMPMDGGELEREEAARYRSDARAAALHWPRTRAMLERMAASYEQDARRHDEDAERRDWL